MKLSIILTVEKNTCLKSSIESILCQNSQEYELLIIFNEIRDENYTYCLKVAGCHTHIRILIAGNQDSTCLENAGIPYVIGEYVMFMRSGDELMRRDAVSLLISYMENYPDVIMFPYQIIDEHNNIIHTSDFQKVIPNRTIGNIYLQMLHLGEFHINASLRVYRREILCKYHLCFFKGIQLKDSYYSLQVCTYLHEYAMIPIPIYRYKKNKIDDINWFTDILLLIDIFENEQKSMEYDMGKFVMEYLAYLYVVGILLYAEREVQEEQLWNQIYNYQSILNYHVLPHVRKISSLHKYCGSRGTVCILKFYNRIRKDICIGGLYGKSCNLYY